MSGQIIKIPVTDGRVLSATFTPESQAERDAARTQMPPLVVMVHGFPASSRAGGEGGLFHRIAMVLSERGLPCLSFDFRGFGESHGRTEDFSLGGAGADLDAVLVWARGAGFEQFLLVAEGLGASVALTRLGPEIKALALLWPVLDPRATALSRFGADPDMAAPAPGASEIVQGRKVGARLIYEMVHTNLLPFLRKVRIPVLIQHGDKDDFAPPEQLDLARAWFKAPRADITVYQGGDHGLTDLSLRKYIIFHIKEFFSKYA